MERALLAQVKDQEGRIAALEGRLAQMEALLTPVVAILDQGQPRSPSSSR
jgi:hypothetical protein